MNTSTGLLKRIMSKTGLYNAQPQVERRQSKRHKIDMPLKYRIFLPSCPAIRTPLLTARIYDLSEHGIGLLTNILDRDGLHIFDPSQQTAEQCHLQIELPYDEEPLVLNGRAAWYIQNPSGHSFLYRVGIQFVGINADIRKKIANFINICVTADAV